MEKFIKSKEDSHKKLNKEYKFYSDSCDEEEFLKGNKDETLQDSDYNIENSLALKRIEWYYSGTADYTITQKEDNFFINIGDLEDIPFKEIKQLVDVVNGLK